VERKDVEIITRNYSDEKRQWLVDLYKTRPILFLDEAKYEFDHEFNVQISRSYISVILREAGLTWKVLERRAIQISEADVITCSAPEDWPLKARSCGTILVV
jgi:transposase